jgi:hypothetical protein
MAKLASTGTMIFFATTATVPLTIVSATKANPCVITVADVGTTKTGDFVSITGGNWKFLTGVDFSGRVYVAGVVDDVLNTIEIRGANTSTEVPTFDPSDAVARSYDAQEICVATFQRTSPPASQIDVTTLCDTVRRKVAGLRDSGTFRFDGYYDAADVAQVFLRNWYAAGTLRRMAVVAPDKSVIVFEAYCTSLGESFGVDQAVTIQCEGMIEGPVYYYGVNTWVDPDAPPAVLAA